MIVESTEGKASKVFYIPATLADRTVGSFDADKRTITVGVSYIDTTNGWTWFENSALTVPEDMDVDFNDLLGRTVTVKYDKKMNLTSLVVDPDETVIYGAFKGSATNKNLTNVVTGDTYKAQATTAGTIRPSAFIDKIATGWAAPTALTDIPSEMTHWVILGQN